MGADPSEADRARDRAMASAPVVEGSSAGREGEPAAGEISVQEPWQREIQEMWQVIDFNEHQLPLHRIKRIMKDDPATKMIAAEAPGLLSKAGEMFVLDLTRRAWGQTERNNRRTLQRSHIGHAAEEKDYFDFLQDCLPPFSNAPSFDSASSVRSP